MYIDRDGNMSAKRVSICTWLDLFFRSMFSPPEEKQSNVHTLKKNCPPSG